MDQFLTLKRAKIGPVFNFTTYMLICVCVCVCARAGSCLDACVLSLASHSCKHWFLHSSDPYHPNTLALDLAPNPPPHHAPYLAGVQVPSVEDACIKKIWRNQLPERPWLESLNDGCRLRPSWQGANLSFSLSCYFVDLYLSPRLRETRSHTSLSICRKLSSWHVPRGNLRSLHADVSSLPTATGTTRLKLPRISSHAFEVCL